VLKNLCMIGIMIYNVAWRRTESVVGSKGMIHQGKPNAAPKAVHLLLLCSLFACGPSLTPSVEPGPVPSASHTSAAQNVRPPAVAGTFYPGEPAELRNMLDTLLEQATQTAQEPIALIVPHAGYVFSGGVAATAFKQLEGRRYETVVVLGTNHRAAGFRKIAVWPEGGYSTPLGVLPVDHELAQLILEAAPQHIVAERGAHSAEHSIEVELPFLLRLFGPQAFVPILIGEPSWENCQALSAALVKVLKGRRSLIIASSDFSHYPRYDDAVTVDMSSLLAVTSLDPQAVLANTSNWMSYGVPNLACTMCGEGPVLTAMMAAQGLGANRATVLQYANSGDTPYGDRNQVVGYAAVAFWRGETAALDAECQTLLLRMARETLQKHLSGEDVPQYAPVPAVLHQPRGAFVTLEKDGQLRGCIGDLWGGRPLDQTVREMVIDAATRDSRFAAVTVEELPEMEIEISVLSPLHYVHDVCEIELGRDGLYIIRGSRSGVLLPQVPVEQGWDKEEFLRQVCLKAGLGGDAWREGAMLYRFEAQVFGEGQ
jgi:AmmeMemoRadiSam system protein B/AmmeMemoRadiSam system protein A